MPKKFKSESQRRYLWAKKPEVADKLAHGEGGDFKSHLQRKRKMMMKKKEMMK